MEKNKILNILTKYGVKIDKKYGLESEISKEFYKMYKGLLVDLVEPLCRNKIKFNTNTAFLLNTWFKDNDCLFKKEREFIKKAHENHWKGKNDSAVEITIKVLQKERSEK